jgi:hypothetical protein
LDGLKEDSPIVGKGSLDNYIPSQYNLDINQGSVDPNGIFTVRVSFQNWGHGDWDPTSGTAKAPDSGRWKLTETPTGIPPIRTDVSANRYTIFLNVRARDLEARNQPLTIQVSAFYTGLYRADGRAGTESRSITKTISLKLLIGEAKSTIREIP